MSSGMWDGADDFDDLEPRSILERFQFTLHSVAFFPFTNNLMINDLMINAALQESYCWQSAEGYPDLRWSLVLYAVFTKTGCWLMPSPTDHAESSSGSFTGLGIQVQPTAASVDI